MEYIRNKIGKDLGLLKKVRKQERLSLETRHEHSISVPNSTSLNQCLQTILELVLKITIIKSK